MKFLHTSDWHLGQQLYGYDRTEEHDSMLSQIIEIVKENKPDALLISGDIYHSTTPSKEVQQWFVNALMQLHNAYADMEIFVTAGNHDSQKLHEIFQSPWETLNIHEIGYIDKENLGDNCIELPGKGIVAALPYCYERNLPDGFYRDVVKEANQINNSQGLPVVVMAHTSVRGSQFEGHDNSSIDNIGGIECVGVEEFGEGYDYVALGHIHKPQWVHGGDGRVRYCGSPVAVSFDEKFSHSVSLVEIGKHGEKPGVKVIEIENPHPLVSLPADGTKSFDEAIQLLRDFPSDNPAYIRLNVELTDALPALANETASKAAEGKQCRFCLINAVRQQTSDNSAKSMTIAEFQKATPIEIAKRYADDSGKVFDDELQSLFNEAVQALNEEKRNN